MDDALCLMLYSALFFATVVLFIVSCSKDRNKFLVRQSIAFYALLLGWQICEMLIFLLSDTAAIAYLFDFKLAFVAYLSVAIFYFVAAFYRLNRNFPRWLLPACCVLPAATAVLAALSPFHSLLTEMFIVYSASPVLTFAYRRGIWFHVHLWYSYLLMAAILVILLLKYRHLPKLYRRGSLWMIFAVFFFFVGILLELGPFGIESALDLNLVGVTLSSFAFFIAPLVNGSSDYMYIRQKEIHHHLDEAVFILNRNGVIVHVNRPALRWLQLVGTSFDHIPFTCLIENLITCGRVIQKSSSHDPGQAYLYVVDTRYPLIFQMRKQTLADSAGHPNGSFVVIRDITRNQLLIERLQDTAGIDSLTGLPNRYRYQMLLRELDREDNLPLSIIVGDVNGLKRINDTLGHSKGDLLIQSVAEALQGSCPPDGYVARVGGDEFIMLLPHCDESDARDIIEAIHVGIRDVPGLPGRPAIALGYSTKREGGQNLNALIEMADEKMYEAKYCGECERRDTLEAALSGARRNSGPKPACEN